MEIMNVCESIQNPEGGRYVVFRDSFLSGWRHCPDQSFFALLVADDNEAQTVVAAGCRRSDFELHSDNMSFEDLRELIGTGGGHVSVRSRALSSRFYEPDGFGESDE